MSINEICEDVQLLNILTIFKDIIGLMSIIVPVVLVIFVIIDIIKTISSSDVDTKKLWKSISKRVISAVMVFLIPFILDLVLNIIPLSTSYYLACYKNAEKDKVILIAKDNVNRTLTDLNIKLGVGNYNDSYVYYEKARQEIKNIPDKSVRENYRKKLETYKVLLQSLEHGNTIKVPNSEGSYQTTISRSTYTVKDVKDILKKYPNLSQERRNIVLKAAEHVDKIPYYWGGTATSKNFSSNKFNTSIVPDQFGNYKKGLDCSHFVDFVFWQVMNDNLGNGNTVHIWDNESYEISESELLPGDVGFEIDYDVTRSKGNHIGIFVGVDDKGNKVWIHEAGSPYNNVVINNRSLPNYRRINITK